MCSWILMSIEYQIITLSLCLGALSLCGVKFPPILFPNVHNVSWMVLPMFSISHSHMGEYSWQWPCQCSQWYFQCSWVILPILLVFHDVLLILLFLASNCCRHVRGWCSKDWKNIRNMGYYMVVMVARVILMMQFLVKMDSEKYSILTHLAPIT